MMDGKIYLQMCVVLTAVIFNTLTLSVQILDLGLGSTKTELMAFADGSGSFVRQRDDETQQYIMEFFVNAIRENVAGFNELHGALTEEEKLKLNELLALQ